MQSGEVDTYAEEEIMSGDNEEFVTRYQCELIRNGMLERLEKIENSLEAMWKKIDGRPSWSVLAIITLLSSLVVGLIVGMVFR